MLANLWRKLRGSQASAALKRQSARHSRRLFLEPLENRSLLATLVVTSTADTIAEDGVVTFREAITSANNNANVNADVVAAGTYGTDTINFNIPGSGVQTISPASALPQITDPVFIDGYTQPGSVTNTNTPDQGGSNAVLLIELSGSNLSGGNGLHVIAADSTIRGLVINRFAGSGIQIDRNRALVAGNFIGVDPTGTVALGNGIGIQIVNGNDTTIGGTTPDTRNVISANASTGVRASTFFQAAVSGTSVLGNLIGTDRTGTQALGNGAFGVHFNYPGTNNRVGGDFPEARNIISGNFTSGVLFSTVAISIINDVSGSRVLGNYIGTDVTGTMPLGNGRHGVEFSLGDALLGHVEVGGVTPADRNIIAFNGQDGVSFDSSTTRNVSAAILSNAIFGNGGLGTDFNNDGVTPNDAGDTDSGPSGLQNFPVITSVSRTGGSTTATGTLNSAPITSFRLEFFANDAADPSSFGEGQTFLGFTNVITDAAGNASFTATLPVATTATQFITATATRRPPESSVPIETSEFSQLIADLALTIADSPDPVSVGQDLTYTLTITNPSLSSPSGPVTLTDTLPANVTFVSATASQGTFTQSGSTVTFALGTVALGGSATATITVRPTAAAAGTTLTNSATVTSLINDPNSVNNTDSETTNVSAAPAPEADLQVTKLENASPAVAGTDLTYTITVTNAGPTDAQTVSLTDPLPTGTTFVSASQASGTAFNLTTPPAGSDGTFTASTTTLAAGASASFTLVLHVSASTPDDTTLNNTATVSSATPDPNPANNSDTSSTGVNTQADLRVTKSASSASVAAAGNLTYTITVTNAGPSDAQGVTLSDLLPPGTTFVSFAPSSGFASSTPIAGAGGTVTASAPSMLAGQTVTFQLVVQVGSGTSIFNTAEVAAATSDPNPANNSASSTTLVQQQPTVATRLTVTLTARQARYQNEFGIFFADDASGRIGNIQPGDPGYARAALSRRQLVFHAKTRIGTKRNLNAPAGAHLGMYLIQNSSSAKFLLRNPENRLGSGPLIFFSFALANPDGFDHVRRPSSTRFAFEDMTFGGDRDFNDLVVDIRPQTKSPLARRH